MALNIDLFKYYSEALEKNNEMIRLHKAKDEQKIVRKRKIFLEVEVSEDEYQAFMKQTSYLPHTHLPLVFQFILSTERTNSISSRNNFR